jgi:hypothetical protein
MYCKLPKVLNFWEVIFIFEQVNNAQTNCYTRIALKVSRRKLPVIYYGLRQAHNLCKKRPALLPGKARQEKHL